MLRAIIANPGDDLPRLVYADWLDEHGQGDRASIIRLQIETPSAQYVSYKRDKAWFEFSWEIGESLKPYRDTLVVKSLAKMRWHKVVWRRGFVAELHCSLFDLIKYGRGLRQFHPLERVTITDRTPDDAISEINKCLWFQDDHYHFTDQICSWLPGFIFNLLPGIEPAKRGFVYMICYPSREAAMAALSAACIAYVKQQPKNSDL